AHTTTGCGKQGFPSAQPYLSHTPGANPFCCMFLGRFRLDLHSLGRTEIPRNVFSFLQSVRVTISIVLHSASHMMILYVGTTLNRAMYALLFYPPWSASTILLVVKM
ncbi:hypothetical protein BO72DRAFT_387657, partial [Aspergillus fijiensis CBS 313.89]